MEDFKKYIKSYRDFPTKGIVFRDVLGLLQENEIFSDLISKMSSTKIITDAQAIISIDARGFIFGSAISFAISKPMIVARKKGKLPGDLVNKNYKLEYGNNSLDVQKEALIRYDSFAIVDDVLATGGTANCVKSILQENDKNVTGLAVVLEIQELGGRVKFSLPVTSQVKY